MTQRIVFLIGMVLFTSLLSASFSRAAAPAVDDPKATALVLKSEQNTMGDSLQSTVTMTITRGSSQRELKFKIQQWKREKALVKVLEPRKDRDTGSLRLGMGLWQYLPNINRVVRIPPSMMLQSWMGSDFTNDDLVKTSSLSRDYTHQIEGTDTIDGQAVTKIVCDPKPDAPVVWGKVRLWVRTADGVSIRQEFFSEHGELLKVMNGTVVKTIGKHTLPTVLTMTVPKKPGDQTTMRFEGVVFDQSIEDSVFTQENLRRAVSGS
jgi:outer membrane lipoprotein-sorting protein